MRIAYIANCNSIHSYKWIKYFADKGHDIAWYSMVGGEYKIDSKKTSTMVMNPQGIVLSARMFEPDVIHAHYVGWNGLIGALTNIHPYVVSVWGSDVIGNYGNILKRKVVKYGLSKADLITVDASHILGVLSKYNVNQQLIKHINYGIDVEKFIPNSIPHRGKIIVSMRSLEKIYDLETLIKAMRLVVDVLPDAMLMIYGDGSQTNNLKKLTAGLNLDDYIEFKGKAKYLDIPKILNSADLYVSTALSDAGLSSSTGEAMACGLPVLVTDIGDNEQWVGYNQVFMCGDHIGLAKMIVDKLKTNETYNNRDIIIKRDNYKIEMSKMSKLYERILKK